MSLLVLRSNVRQLVRDAAEVLSDPADYNLSIQEAAKRYSRARPRRLVVDLVGGGGFDLALPDTWSDTFSRLLQVEYPVGRREPATIDALDWALYRAPSGTLLRLRADTPAVGATVRITFTAMHQVTAEANTVPEPDRDILVYLAAAHCCEQLASHFSNASEPTLLADSVDHKSKAAEYAMRAKRFHQLADQLLPIKEQGTVAAAGGMTSWGEQAAPFTHPHR